MLKIKLLTILADAVRRGNPGDEIIVDDEEGEALIRAGYANIVMTGEELEAQRVADAQRAAEAEAEAEAVEKARAAFRASLLRGERPASVVQQAPAPVPRTSSRRAARATAQSDQAAGGVLAPAQDAGQASNDDASAGTSNASSDAVASGPATDVAPAAEAPAGDAPPAADAVAQLDLATDGPAAGEQP
ncbi:hypothetical protein H5407_09240 [Mitsuaria sp. WAJ17]|uniref:hypothetical protein n=1 Tax=Mitsuaria sp. WAJ17 TaxID=2761452 RepID=UPI0016018390|nr:hypothetical protein [Mitsuaria sp. WAJ17]MBB2485410.1 hypothetical protein [Mitsuaria sp. WAJ17]